MLSFSNHAEVVSETEELWSDGKFDLLVLDISLPDGSCFEFCTSDGETSIIMGLDIGGDDYITKPFNL